MKQVLLLATLVTLYPALAYAGCTNPEGDKGEQVYNATHDTMQFCNGNVWLRMDTAPVEEWTDATSFIHSGTDGVAIGTNRMNPATHKLVVTGKAQAGSWVVDGVNNSSTVIQKGSSAGGMALMTTAMRNGIDNPPQGSILYNTQTQRVEYYDGNQWAVLAAVTPTYVGVGGADVPYYPFTSHRFTNCSQTGNTGPAISACRTSYNTSWDADDQYYTMNTQGIQEWVVPIGGVYRITVAGAQGGGGGSISVAGAEGAIVRGDVTLNRDDVLKILVGQQGLSGGGAHGNENGGGGGSFVTDASNNPIMIAGGGGGGYSTSHGGSCSASRNLTHARGQHGTSTVAFTCSGTAASVAGPFAGSASGSYVSGAGAGLSADGIAGQVHCGNANGGMSFVSGGMGGASGGCYGSSINAGGFGGASKGNLGSPGAGGGYAGGSTRGSWSGHSTYGGGGSSFKSGANQTDLGYNTGHGYVEIELLP